MSTLMPDLSTWMSGLSEAQRMMLIIAILWDAVWKAIGLWKSARNGQMAWFIAILLVNIVGIVPIVYITWFQKEKVHRHES